MKTNCHILIVEDDEDIRHQLTLIIEDEGYRNHAVQNGKEAHDYLTSLSPSEYPCCIILDLMMPIMSGSELFHELQKDPELLKIPIIIATAKGSKNKDLESIPLHIDRVNKPMEIEDLMNVVDKYCK